MKNSEEQKSVDKKAKKHSLRLVWKNDDPQPQNTVRLEFIGELMPYSNTTIPVIKNLPWLNEEMKNESND
jgi:hypothetical protein